MSKAEKERPPSTALAVAANHSLVGSIDEQIRAFDQISANMATLQMNGWDTVQKCKAACWLAHGKQEHPAVFIENHYVMLIKGRLTVEPKWEYMVRKLKETVPGFRFKVLEEDAQGAKVSMSDGVDTHEVGYTLEDARRQGLLGRGENAWTTGSTREMCLKQAVKRAARRLGVGRAAPWVEVEGLALPEPEPSGAVVVEDETAAVASAPASTGTPPEPAPVAAVDNPIAALSVALVKLYSKQSKAVMLEKASFVYNQMMREQTGTDPRRAFMRADQIGPVEAQQMVDYLAQRKEPAPGQPLAPGGIAAEEPPPAESADVDYDTFSVTINRAKKLFGRKFVAEYPIDSGKFWFVDQATFAQAGKTASVKLMDKGEVVVSQPDLQQLNRILAADCDAAERGGR